MGPSCRSWRPSTGLDGRRYLKYSDIEAWDLCRTAGKAIRSGTYRPRDDKPLKVAKNSGTGERVLHLPSIIDRTVQRAAMQILQPLLDPGFDSRSFGFRPGVGSQNALASAERLAQRQNRWVFVAHDVRDAFSHVPIPRLMGVVRKQFPDDSLIEFLRRLLTSRRPGLRQGGPLSPLMLNVYLDHFLDRSWRRNCPEIPLLRYADDILLLCANMAEASQAEAELRRILSAAGMPLKAVAEEAIQDLSGGRTSVWMGTRIYRAFDELAIELTPMAWRRLRNHFRSA